MKQKHVVTVEFVTAIRNRNRFLDWVGKGGNSARLCNIYHPNFQDGRKMVNSKYRQGIGALEVTTFTLYSPLKGMVRIERRAELEHFK